METVKTAFPVSGLVVLVDGSAFGKTDKTESSYLVQTETSSG